ncbi:protein dead ringer-like isoform X2 [Lutzomyia longipalpis]|uniref:protein dead ringer-like isoform X2 n=1 Tax=Lutzomyia longipalpis TaxID=7200 RepID=UPI002483E0CB|nr:protein dead ringer-like isoform X2 [Lutzomyia longipalpis]
MDGGRIDRDSDLGDDSPMSHTDEQSDEREDDMRDCDSSDEGVNVNANSTPMVSSGMDYPRSPEHPSESHLNAPHHFGQNHPLGVLGSLTALNMGVPGLQGLQGLHGLQHGDVLEKLKMQVRDMKVGLMDQEFALHAPFGGASMQAPPNVPFSMPPLGGNHRNSSGEPQNLSSQPQTNSSNGFPFTPPNAPNSSTKDANPGSNSSTSSEASNSSQHQNGWSFEEQFKQVRQLYEINDDPKRKEFLDDLFSFMQKRGTPINRLPIMAKSVLDLYELYNLVIARGGLVDVINKKLWQEIIKGLHLPSSITSAAFTLRTQYMKYLYPYECDKKNLSTPAELQAAIDGNRREGRRSSYGQFDPQMQGQLQMPPVQRSPVTSNIQQMSPLSLVTHGNAPSAHHRLMGAPTVGQMPNIVPHELEQRMMEYIKLFQSAKEPRRSQSPELSREALNALEMSRVAMWSIYNNNASPPTPLNTASPPGTEPPQREALNLSESPPHVAVKRERDHLLGTSDYTHDGGRDREYGQPPIKRGFHPFATPSATHEAEPPHPAERTPESPVLHTSQRNGNALDSNHVDKNNRHQMNQSSGSDASVPVIAGMQFKLTQNNGEQQVVVTMEVNGMLYEGILFAHSPASASSANANSADTSSGAVGKTRDDGSSPAPDSQTTNNSMDERSSRAPRPLVSS